MTKYREILRLKSLGLSQQSIADSCNVSKKTVNRVLKRAKELNISWPLDKSDTDAVLAEMFFPSTKQVRSNKRMPNYDYVHKELLRNGVSKKLLWTEYMEDCHANGEEPLMYSQFCYHIQQDEQKRRATMHINRKPGEQVEVVESLICREERDACYIHAFLYLRLTGKTGFQFVVAFDSVDCGAGAAEAVTAAAAAF